MPTPHRRSFRVTAGAVAGLTVLSLGLAACGGEEEPASDPQEAVDAPEKEKATWPLTGLTAQGDVEQDHPVLVLKMDNTEASAPQEGLGTADLVVEELVEGGITRLAAFFYADIPGVVGPVRSVRASDIGIVSPVDGTLVTSGGAQVTLGRLKEAGVPFLQEGAAGFRRDETRSAPYNLFADLGAVAKETEDGEAARPDDYLPWGTPADLPKGKPATSLTADFGSHATNWTFENGSYVNQNTYAAQGDEFPAESVLVLRVDVGDAGYLDPAGNPVPETLFEGEGDAQLFHDGRVVQGTWSKDGLEDAISLSTADGDLQVPAGRVWIELVPVDDKGGSVSYQK